MKLKLNKIVGFAHKITAELERVAIEPFYFILFFWFVSFEEKHQILTAKIDNITEQRAK